MSVPSEPCPNCLYNQPVTAEHCGVCGHLLYRLNPAERLARGVAWLGWKRIAILLLAIAFCVNTFFPAPYSWVYWMKRAILTETAECQDGIYSFASHRSGQCSSHGGVIRWLN